MSAQHTRSAVTAARAPEAADEWAALAPRLAARGRMRVARNGHTYRLRDERPVTGTLPNQPTAVLVYDHTGCAPVLCLDLDTARARDLDAPHLDAEARVERDTAHLTRLLHRLGAAWFSDRSPSGGRHIYVPLATPAPLHEVREVMRGLCAVAPTLDPQPMLNIAAGCIRPPGARHKSGGHQRLDQTISAAVGTFHHPTSDQAWSALLSHCRHVVPTEEHPAPDRQAAPQEPKDADVQPRLEPLHGHHGPDETYLTIARTGQWDTARYATPSEARQAVIWAAAASGWGFADVARRLADGTWPGLASLYARYSPKNRHRALVLDWRNAVSFESRRRNRAAGTSPVRQRTTSQHQSHAREGRTDSSVQREARVWLAAVDLLTRREDLGVRAVLYAMAEAAVLKDSLVVEHGNRSLAIATGLDQATVGRALKKIRSWPRDRALVDLVRPAEGVRAHAYGLVVPALLRPACEKKPWRRGRVYAIRPAFRELGMAAAFVYAALERAREPLGGRDVAQDAGLGHSATYEALTLLATWGLAERTPAGWRLGGASLQRLAEAWGVTEQVQTQMGRYRAEREAWWRRLGIIRLPLPEEPPADPWGLPPPPEETAADTERVPDTGRLLLLPPTASALDEDQRMRESALNVLESVFDLEVLSVLPRGAPAIQ